MRISGRSFAICSTHSTPRHQEGKWPYPTSTTVDWAFDFGDMQLFGEYQAPMGKPIDAAIVGLITDANDTSVLDKIKFERHIYLRKAYTF